MKLYLIIYFGLFLSLNCIAQDVETNRSSRPQLCVFAGIGRATIHTNIDAPTNFATMEARAGIGLRKLLGDYFELRSRLTLGVRGKRDSDPWSGIDARLSDIDENSSNRNHYFYEIPLFIQYNIPNCDFGVRAGGDFRQYLPSKPVDGISAQSEFGIIGGAYYSINQRINVGMDYCFFLTKMLNAGVFSNNEFFNVYEKNRFAQLTFEMIF